MSVNRKAPSPRRQAQARVASGAAQSKAEWREWARQVLLANGATVEGLEAIMRKPGCKCPAPDVARSLRRTRQVEREARETGPGAA